MTDNLLNAILLILAASASAMTAVVTWRRGRDLPCGPPLAMACLALTCWSGTCALYWLGVPAPYPPFWLDLSWVGGVLLIPASFLFAVRYIEPQWRISRLVLVALAVEPVLVLFFVFTDSGHGLFFGGTPTRSGTILAGGPVFWLNQAYSYILVLSSYVLLLREFFRVRGIYRRQVGLILLGVLVPTAVNVAGTVGQNPLRDLDLTPITFTFTSFFWAYALFRYGLLDVVPVARHALIESMSDAVLVLDARNRIVDANPAFARLAGMPPEQMLGRLPSDALSAWAGVVARYRGVNDAQDEIVLEGSPPRYLDLRIVPLYGHNRVSGRLLVVRDVSERRRAETALVRANEQLQIQLGEITRLQDQLREQAIRDPLTGLFNRRYLEETLAREVAAASRAGQPLSVAIIDADYFKQVNDTGGHEAGDRMLQELAKLLLASTRDGDVVSRFGGEEFVVVLSGASVEQARRRAETWRAGFEQLCVPYEGKLLRTTLSVGIGGYPQHGLDGAELLRAADAALYQAKQSGRNRVVVFGPDEPQQAAEHLPAIAGTRA